MYKTLLVPIDARPRSTRSVDMAGRIARLFGSHVVGLYVKPIPYVPAEFYGAGGAHALEELIESIEETAASAQAQFDGAAEAAGIESYEWRVAEGERIDVVATQARCADLVVVNQTDPSAADATHFADTVLLSLGRPALVVPYAGEFEQPARQALVCWNASREAARAATDALPLLRRAERVTVMTIDGKRKAGDGADATGSDLVPYLARHDVKAEAELAPSGGVDVGNLILSRAAEIGAELVVMGAYGHSRLREIVLGGATRTVLKSLTVPVLMSH